MRLSDFSRSWKIRTIRERSFGPIFGQETGGQGGIPRLLDLVDDVVEVEVVLHDGQECVERPLGERGIASGDPGGEAPGDDAPPVFLRHARSGLPEEARGLEGVAPPPGTFREKRRELASLRIPLQPLPREPFGLVEPAEGDEDLGALLDGSRPPGLERPIVLGFRLLQAAETPQDARPERLHVRPGEAVVAFVRVQPARESG